MCDKGCKSLELAGLEVAHSSEPVSISWGQTGAVDEPGADRFWCDSSH